MEVKSKIEVLQERSRGDHNEENCVYVPYKLKSQLVMNPGHVRSVDRTQLTADIQFLGFRAKKDDVTYPSDWIFLTEDEANLKMAMFAKNPLQVRYVLDTGVEELIIILDHLIEMHSFFLFIFRSV
jgi:hypothetical protein